jgi:predicted dehydrogenase
MAAAVPAAAALSACSNLRSPSRVRAANDQVAYGVIGVGSRATRLLNLLKNVDNGRCVALCDIYQPNLDAAKQLVGQPVKTFKDYRVLLADPAIDAVLIATPLFQHFPMTRDALLAGKHVFCEKCLVFKAHEVHALRALAAQHPKQVLQTGLQRRYSPFYLAAKAMVEKGMIGDVTHIRAQWHRNGSGRRPVNTPELDRQINWRFYREFSGGLTAELASHQIDVADWIFGTVPEFVTGVGGIDYWKDGRDTFDNVQLIFQYPKGCKLMYSSISTNSLLPFSSDRNRNSAKRSWAPAAASTSPSPTPPTPP